jgi:hypothetical protein
MLPSCLQLHILHSQPWIGSIEEAELDMAVRATPRCIDVYMCTSCH